MPDKPAIREIIDSLASEPPSDPAQNVAATRKKAMDYLARREYGRRELVGKLVRTGYHADVAEDVVAGLAADGLQDDRRFAENFVASRTGKGQGPVRIRAELAQRGIKAAVVDAALDAAGVGWGALAREVRVKKFGPGLPRDFTEKARQMRFLQYRGFESDQIQAAISSAED